MLGLICIVVGIVSVVVFVVGVDLVVVVVVVVVVRGVEVVVEGFFFCSLWGIWLRVFFSGCWVGLEWLVLVFVYLCSFYCYGRVWRIWVILWVCFVLGFF